MPCWPCQSQFRSLCRDLRTSREVKKEKNGLKVLFQAIAEENEISEEKKTCFINGGTCKCHVYHHWRKSPLVSFHQRRSTPRVARRLGSISAREETFVSLFMDGEESHFKVEKEGAFVTIGWRIGLKVDTLSRELLQ